MLSGWFFSQLFVYIFCLHPLFHYLFTFFFRSDGRRQPVIYTFLRGNEASAFEINSNNGIIRVRDPEVIDYEKNKQFVLTIQGQGLGVEDDLNAFTTCIIKVKNVNDNVPKFTQNMYIARVLEGLPKASLVTTVTAFDLDYEQSNDDITYEIIGGNVDEAFYMTTAQPGVILTNTVLDREIRFVCLHFEHLLEQTVLFTLFQVFAYIIAAICLHISGIRMS